MELKEGGGGAGENVMEEGEAADMEASGGERRGDKSNREREWEGRKVEG